MCVCVRCTLRPYTNSKGNHAGLNCSLQFDWWRCHIQSPCLPSFKYKGCLHEIHKASTTPELQAFFPTEPIQVTNNRNLQQDVSMWHLFLTAGVCKVHRHCRKDEKNKNCAFVSWDETKNAAESYTYIKTVEFNSWFIVSKTLLFIKLDLILMGCWRRATNWN